MDCSLAGVSSGAVTQARGVGMSPYIRHVSVSMRHPSVATGQRLSRYTRVTVACCATAGDAEKRPLVTDSVAFLRRVERPPASWNHADRRRRPDHESRVSTGVAHLQSVFASIESA